MEKTYCLSIQKRSSYSSRDAVGIPAAYAHNTRTYSNEEFPKNIDKNLSHLNKTLIELPEGETYSTLCKKAEKESSKLADKKVRKDAVRALTFVCNYQGADLSPEQVYQWANDSIKWIKANFGENNVKHAVVHMDEPNTSPHLHVMAIPVDERGRLCCSNIIKETFHTLQDKYYNEVARNYGFNRGAPYKKRNLDLKTIAQYKYATITRNMITEEELSPRSSELDSNGKLVYEKDEDGRERCPYLERLKTDIQDMKWQQSKKEMDTQNRYNEYFSNAAHLKYESEKELNAEKERYKKKLDEEYRKKQALLDEEYKEKEKLLTEENGKLRDDNNNVRSQLKFFDKYLSSGESYEQLAKRFKGFVMLNSALSLPENAELKNTVNKVIHNEHEKHKMRKTL